MLGSLFISRALLSISLIAFIALTTIHSDFAKQFRNFIRKPQLLSISLLFLIPLVSGIWSENVQEWANVFIRKIPFLFLPLAFAGDWKLKENEWSKVALCFIGFTLIACGWSTVQYIHDAAMINESYLRAKTIPTPLDDDHVRFSWLICIAIITCIFFLERLSGLKKILLLLAVFLMTAYLHLLSARTGLLLLYLFGFCYIIYRFRKMPGNSLVIFVAMLLMFVIGWFCFPTLRNRINYNRYDLSFVLKNEYRSGTSDGNRVASLKAGWALLSSHPWTGVGAGDIWDKVDHWYDENLETTGKTDLLYPSNEWLVHGCMAGWPGVVLFSLAVFVPLCIKQLDNRFFWIMFHILALLVFLIETSLETQYGIFIYIFISLWWWKWFGLRKEL